MKDPGLSSKFRNMPFNPTRLPFFYGWVVLGAGTLGMVMSAPGQTVGVSVFTDPLIESLGVNRNLLSLGYLVGTLSSALLLSRAGRLYDRRGGRLVATGSALALALTLIYLSYCVRISGALSSVAGFLPPTLVAFIVVTVGFFLLRFSGQGVLTLASRNMVMEWFEKRRGLANAIMGVSISFGFSYAPRIFESFVSANGWQIAWRWIAAWVAAFAVIAFMVYRDTPEAHGLKPDGGEVQTKRHHPESSEGPSFTVAQARRTYSFWVFALALFLASLTITAFTFHIVSVFGDAGMSRARAVGIFFPASIVAVALQFTASWISDRIKLKYLCVVQAAGIVVLSLGMVFLSDGPSVVVLIVGQGTVQGMFGVTSNITWPRFFGRRHLGAVSGLASALAVAGSAIGPYFFSFIRELTGAYAAPALACAVAGSVLLVAAFRAERPVHPDSSHNNGVPVEPRS